MYHIALGPDGTKYLCRDLEAVLWHCGAWPQNQTALSVHVPIGTGQHATPAQIRALAEICQDWIAAGHGTAQQVWGHEELSSTDCPGTLMEDFVLPWRAGTFNLTPASVEKPDHAQLSVPGIGERWIVGNIYKRWAERADNVAIFGYPLSGMFADKNGHNTQIFERTIMREVPGVWTEEFDVQLDRLGAQCAEARGFIDAHGAVHRAFAPIASVKDTGTVRYFQETGHTVSNGFKAFWDKHGGVNTFGFPISQEFTDAGAIVQYFERSRFEWHPGTDATEYDVLLGRLGAEVYSEAISG